jgi:hypothetical protein
MSKSIIWLTLIAVLAFTLTATTVVSADSGDPTPQPRNCGLLDNLFNRAGCGRNAGDFGFTGGGILHEYMEQIFADKLGIPETEIETRLADGETMSQIAVAEGLTLQEFQAWMLDARSQAIDLAVADGTITQEQADWMNSRGGMMFGGTGRSQGFGMMGRSGGRMGGFGNGTCPNLP